MGRRNELSNEQAALQARIEENNHALSLYKEDAVEILTKKNIRNSSGVFAGSTSEDEEGGEKKFRVSVYADRELNYFADPSDHGGYVSGEDAAWLIVNGYKDYVKIEGITTMGSEGETTLN